LIGFEFNIADQTIIEILRQLTVDLFALAAPQPRTNGLPHLVGIAGSLPSSADLDP
jgi:hypothetical protein